jgi:glucan biosynthesis protein C
MILTFLGFAHQYFSFSSPFLGYANRAVLPFYILHQPVLVGIGFFVVQWQIPDLLKYTAITIPAFILVLGLYEFLVRRSNPLRLMFGMKVLQRPSKSAESAPIGGLNFYSSPDEKSL